MSGGWGLGIRCGGACSILAHAESFVVMIADSTVPAENQTASSSPPQRSPAAHPDVLVDSQVFACNVPT